MDFREFRPFTIKPLSYELHTASRIITINGHQSHIPTILEATEQESKDLRSIRVKRLLGPLLVTPAHFIKHSLASSVGHCASRDVTDPLKPSSIYIHGTLGLI